MARAWQSHYPAVSEVLTADAVLALLLAAGKTEPGDHRLEGLAELLLDASEVEELLSDSMRAELWVRLASDILPHICAAHPEAASLTQLARQVQSLAK